VDWYAPTDRCSLSELLKTDEPRKTHLAVPASIEGLNYDTRWGVKNGTRRLSRMLGTFGIAHMHDIVARVKRTILAHIVLVGTPEGKVRPRRRADEEGGGWRYTLHCLA